MKNAICNKFKSYLRDAENIFDIMAAAYKLSCPYESDTSLVQDSSLEDIVSCFTEQSNMIKAFAELKDELVVWIHNLNENEIKGKLLRLVRLIDRRCVGYVKPVLPDPYIRYFSLNELLQDNIIILPRYRSKAMDLLSKAVKEKQGHYFCGRNYSSTKDVGMCNFVIYQKNGNNICPQINVANYYKELLDEFEKKGYKLVVAVFPLSNINLRKLFLLKEGIVGTEGIFKIEVPYAEQEKELLERCKEALEVCVEYCVDIAVFPEMLFTERNKKAIVDYIKSEDNKNKRFPWFMWLGTSWAERENKCVVIDQYGNEVFAQRKYVPYEYTRKRKQTIIGPPVLDEKEKVTLREDLSHDAEWIVNFLDIPGFLRIATAICRDISDNYLNTVVKELYSNMVVIPAFSNSDRLTQRNIEPLAHEQINTLVCNACSANCADNQKKYEMDPEMEDKGLPFCYLCMVARKQDNNSANFYRAKYTQTCADCDKCCKGFIWEITFSECAEQQGGYSAKVVHMNS